VTRRQEDLNCLLVAIQAALANEAPLPADERLLVNDLQGPAISLCPEIAGALEEAAGAGAGVTRVSGSGPTVLALFEAGAGVHETGTARAERAAARLAGRVPPALVARPVGAAFARVVRHNPAESAKRRST
jgi:4-diphosphocytidyl-2C-methyl-D-erythritol kinase